MDFFNLVRGMYMFYSYMELCFSKVDNRFLLHAYDPLPFEVRYAGTYVVQGVGFAGAG